MRSSIHRLLLATAAGSLIAIGATHAHAADSAVSDPGHPRVNQVNRRAANQDKRIANGIANGSLNANEAARLNRGEARLDARESADLAAHDGHLTKPEQRQLNRAENRMSRRIYVQKHDGN